MLKFLPIDVPAHQLTVIFTRKHLHIPCLSVRTHNTFGQINSQLEVDLKSLIYEKKP